MSSPLSIEAKLEQTRRQLLDLSRRNRLLNHKKNNRGALEIVDELPELIFQILVGKGRKMQFKALEEAPRDSPLRPSETDGELTEGPDLPLAPIAEEKAAAARHADRYLQTALDGVELQKRLVSLARKARSALMEQGCNILYLTLGLVEWTEQSEDGQSLAPLVFVPVTLSRANVNSRYSLERLDEDVICNPCLIELCERHFKCSLPQMEIDEDFELPIYLDAVGQAVDELDSWRVLPEIALGCFSFAKFLMYRDLDPGNWPQGQALGGHALVRQLSGFEAQSMGSEQSPDLPDPRTLDASVRPSSCFQVLDADASQQVAALAVKQGLSLVIEGPPGTGKSQTITNIIAELMASRRTVLFVAEKAAALEVVRRRLTSVGLGEFVLELHSRKTSKRNVLDELRRTLDGAPERAPGALADDAELCRQRDQLNATVFELHEPMGGLNISPFVAICRAVELAGLPEAQCGIPDPMGWSEADLGQAVTDLDSLDRRLERVGDLAVHPWRHTGLTTAPLTVRQALEEKRAALATGVARVRELAAALAESLGLDPSATVAGIAGQVEEGNRLAEAPQIPASVLAHLGWKSDGGREDWLAAGSRYVEQRGGWSVEMIDEAEELDWGETLSRRRSQHASVLRFFRWSWYADGKRIREHHRDGVLPPIGKQLDLLQALVACRRARNHVRSEEARQAEPFGDFWQGLHSDWQALRRLADSVPAFQRRMDAGHLGRQATEAILGSADRGRLTDLLRQADDALEVARAAWVAWVEAVQAEAESWIGSAWDGVSLAEVSARLDEIAERFDTLQDWADYRAVEQPLRAGKARGFLDWAESEGGAVARGQLGRTFLRHLYRLWIDEAFQQRATLAGFSGEDHQDLIERFAAADRGWISGMRGQLAGQIRTHRPDMSYAAHKTSKLGIVQAEIRKKRRHMPLRRLLSTAGEVIQAIKPCLMMSPISVAQYLEPGGLEFDVVIFDEASQVEPADAYGAIARGSQVVLVGDENQLPPTSFFSRVQSDGPPAEGEELGAGDLESILSLGVVRLPHRCRLRWHYRSRHESLIRFSSDEFYDGDLRIFPSPHTGCEVMGLTFRHVADGVYMRGQGQHNPREASVVAQAVLAHALETPQLTLGVGAFSVQQQRAIEDEIERLRREHADPKREAFFLSHEDEPFFVKNLETIQGDERDVIFLSVGYGPDPSGRLTMNFGPLNRDGGWRRLNVLVTRSRRRCVCFSSIRADDIDLGRTRALGVTALKRYLHTAEHGQLGDDRDAVGDQELEAVQVDLCSALEAAGWETRTRVGVGGFAIDIAVVDPDHPERYLVGIECDGESYRSVFTARDRDRLRRQVLEALGWRVERVWSVDWFKRREETLAALLGKLNNARREPRRYEEIAPPAGHASGSQPADEVVDFGESPEPVRLAPTKPEDVIPYYRRRREPLGNHEALVSAAVLRVVALIGQVVADEAPVHVDEVLRVLTGLYRTRATKRPRAAFEEALELTLERGLALRRGDFLWRSANQAIPVRRRDGDCPVTRAELIAPEELGEAVKIVVGRAFGIKQDALVESTARLLGFSRLGKKIAIVIGAAVTNLIASGAIVTDDQGFLQLRSDP